jgi:hypothetical protein
MNQTKSQIVTLMVFLGIGSVGLCAEPFAKGPYLGQTPPGPVAQVFAPGLICNTGKHPWEANGTFSADGNTFCFNRRSGIFITENTEQGWTTPELIRSIPANTYSPWLGCLSPDANSIFFTRATDPVSKRNLYRCDRTAHGWTAPHALGPPLSSPAKELTCSIASNNNIYILRGGSEGGIFYAPYVNNTWPRTDRISLNHPHAGDPGIAPDESFMVSTAKDLPGGYGHQDLYLILRQPDGTWSKPRNLGPKINSAYIEFGPRISPDKKYLFFNRSNGWDPGKHGVRSYIYWVELKEYLPESYR